MILLLLNLLGWKLKVNEDLPVDVDFKNFADAVDWQDIANILSSPNKTLLPIECKWVNPRFISSGFSFHIVFGIDWMDETSRIEEDDSMAEMS